MEDNYRMTDFKIGTGACVPPVLEQVVIYFIEKECSEDTALNFFNRMRSQDWKNLKGAIIKNWKQHAWRWILNLSIKK
ncbi:hypothetical protein [Sphingobacterium detergens]|uniref:Uncharacterized protein n=1 Tax=Sphingobacterium detergens TaxID=1145106 RepID=A0A420B716_SPHD1|nr:hypothetical protein [Sphingobacterium detergens]RKE52459.1 hypothetical protein DFQ12_2696 [Sphingobacterium detergens]